MSLVGKYNPHKVEQMMTKSKHHIKPQVVTLACAINQWTSLA
jgi:hypothetical protein